MKSKTHKIAKIAPGSVAEELGISVGDELVSVNEKPILDFIQYEVLTSEPEFTLEIMHDGELTQFDVEMEPDEELGIAFESWLMDTERCCANRCCFCFVDQLPENVRETMRFKDDDWRMSFLMGNYVTLTNLRRGELERIAREHISPLYVSVHTANPKLRVKLLGNRFAGEIMKQLRYLDENGISIHAQAVLCPGINDGKELEYTLQELSKLKNLQSFALVPVGLTEHREGLFELHKYNRAEAAAVIRQAEAWQLMFLRTHGKRMVYPSDEFYLTAGLSVPDWESYEGFPQLENGVGLCRVFEDEFNSALERCNVISRSDEPKRICAVTGVSACDLIARCADKLNAALGTRLTVYGTENRFFGRTVTVTGLLTGRCIREGLEGKPLYDGVLLPDVLLKANEDVLLDDTTVTELEKQLGVPVYITKSDGMSFLVSAAGLSGVEVEISEE